VRSKLIASGAAVAVAASAAFAATAVFGDDNDRLPYTTVEVEMRSPSATPGGAPLERAQKAKQPKILYFGGQGAVDVAATGPYVDVKLTAKPEDACPRVVDGGVQVANLDVFQQGSSVGPGPGEYHVLIAFEDETTPVNYTFTSHLVCLKNVR
jgi:hypothetical protein